MSEYRVVIIDDEDIIVRGLERVVDWQSRGCRVVGTANSAAEGAVAIHEHRPDIVFTDIQMPDGTGLAMLAGLRSEFPNMQITVLTGFGTLEYAQEAIKLGVARFLQKPSKMDDIYEALDTMTSRLSAAGISPEDIDESDGGGSRQYVINRAMEYLQVHYTEKITLQDLADHCYVTTYHMSRILNRTKGQSLSEIINSMRVNRAKELLADPRMRVSDISDDLGYTDPAHFVKVFKKLTGVSPADYRNSL